MTPQALVVSCPILDVKFRLQLLYSHGDGCKNVNVLPLPYSIFNSQKCSFERKVIAVVEWREGILQQRNALLAAVAANKAFGYILNDIKDDIMQEFKSQFNLAIETGSLHLEGIIKKFN